ncbi:VOC family protein [Mycetocola tolaasinivorans]|uniref:VOC family protein n=1 Tax=Mycetocola tolaasinivorans TaxID=76635 RepID=A0A3L7A800_9MICO|nr:VOC family protein [Mycetocola tolaasinivorans]RLP76459.1 VOC family protein [Mycetocola tolaasinivorans]
MTVKTIGVTLDCVDVKTAAAFWKDALGYDEPAPYIEGAQFHGLLSPGGGLHHLTLQLVTEPKAGKNRAHLDVFTDDLDAEITRLVSLGASVSARHDDEGGYRTAVMLDPLGNEFCIVQG